MSDEAIISQLGHIETNHAALLAAGAALGSPRTHNTPDARPYAVVPEGYTIEELPSAARPERHRVNQLRPRAHCSASITRARAQSASKIFRPSSASAASGSRTINS